MNYHIRWNNEVRADFNNPIANLLEGIINVLFPLIDAAWG